MHRRYRAPAEPGCADRGLARHATSRLVPSLRRAPLCRHPAATPDVRHSLANCRFRPRGLR